MKSQDKQLRRIVRFIDEVKRDRYPNAKTFTQKLKDIDAIQGTDLAVCTKTIKRDIEYLKNSIGAPLEYDRSEHGYFLYMRDWTFPELALSGNELFAELFTRRISMQSVLPSLKEHLETGLDIQMTVGSTQDLNVSALNSVICATAKTVEVDNKISDILTDAWKNCVTVEVSYAKSKNETSNRRIDIHALFLSDKVWYCRAYCHERRGWRNFSLHKFRSALKTDNKFVRSQKVINDLNEGNLFHYSTFPLVKIHCCPEVSDYISDREWFAQQTIDLQEDGSLIIAFANVPEQAVKSWIMSFSGQATVIEPISLRQDIFNAAQKMATQHS